MDRLDGNPNFMTTDDVDGNITDSAAAATAMATGEKSFDGARSPISLEQNERSNRGASGHA